MYLFHALNRLHILPSQWLEMDMEEKAFVIASIDLYVEQQKKEQQKLKNSVKG